MTHASTDDWSHRPRIFTAPEAAAAVLADFQVFRDDIRDRARHATGPEQAWLRSALVDVVMRFNELEDRVLHRFGQPPPGPDDEGPVAGYPPAARLRGQP